MDVYLNIQAGTLAFTDHMSIYGPTANKISLYSPNTFSGNAGGMLHECNTFPESGLRIAGKRVFDHFADLVHARGHKIFIWWPVGVIGRWQRTDLWKPNWNVANLPGIPDNRREDILNYSLPEVRNAVCQVFENWLQSTPADGIALDYIRGKYRTHEVVDGFREGVDDVVARTSAIARSLGKGISAHVFHMQMDNGVPLNYRYAQSWPEWLDAGYLDFVCPFAYNPPDKVASRLVDLPQRHIDKIYPKITPGTTRTVTEKLTPSQYRECIDIVLDHGHPTPSYWDWQRHTIDHFAVIDDLKIDPPAPSSRKFRIEGEITVTEIVQ
jgi:hypothetical protein